MTRIRLNFFRTGLRSAWLGACSSLFNSLRERLHLLPGLQELEIHVSADDVLEWLMVAELDEISIAMMNFAKCRGANRLGFPYVPVRLNRMIQAWGDEVDIWEVRLLLIALLGVTILAADAKKPTSLTRFPFAWQTEQLDYDTRGSYDDIDNFSLT